VRALEAAEMHYRDAYDFKVQRRQNDAFYPFVNAVVARLARQWLGGLDDTVQTRAAVQVPRQALDVEIAELARLEEALKSATDFWSLGFFAEAELLRRLYRATTASDDKADGDAVAAITASELVARFRDAQKRGRSHREMDSVVTQMRFLAVFAGRSGDSNVQAVGHELERLAQRLTTG